MSENSEIAVKDVLIRTMTKNGIDYICITVIARQKNFITHTSKGSNSTPDSQMLILESDNNRHLLK